MLSVDVFWSFRSPWSYLATPRLTEWHRKYNLEVVFRPVYPIAIRTPDFFNSVNPQWFPYFMRDVFRVAEFLDLPFQWANPDPVIQIREEGSRPRTAEDQPYIHRLTRLGVLAEELGAGIGFADVVSSLIWTTDNWDQGEHLARAASAAGLDLADMDRRIIDEEERIEGVIAANEKAHVAAGHWGVPTMVYEGEPFFGQDRLDVLLWRLQKDGLTERS